MMDGCFPDKPVASGKRVWLGFQEFVVEFLNIRRHVSRKGRANQGNRQEGQKLREAWEFGLFAAVLFTLLGGRGCLLFIRLNPFAEIV